MTVLRVDHSLGGWVAIPRAAMEDRNLDADSVGVLAFLLVKPQNWEVRPDALRRHFNLGRTAWARITKQLISAGYYQRRTERNKLGQLQTEVVVSPLPLQQDAPGAGFPTVGEPAAGSTGGRRADSPSKEHKKEENNNNAGATAPALVVVDFQSDILQRGLLDACEIEQLQRALGSVLNGQAIADELSGALRARGRTGARGIKNAVQFARTLTQAAPEDLTYAPAEAGLRAARAAASRRSMPTAEPAPAPREAAAPVPQAVRDLLARLKTQVRL